MGSIFVKKDKEGDYLISFKKGEEPNMPLHFDIEELEGAFGKLKRGQFKEFALVPAKKMNKQIRWIEVEFDKHILTTAKAHCFKVNGEDVWIPIQYVKQTNLKELQFPVTLTVAEWIAKAKGLVGTVD